ncbi:MAG: alpha/beta hydrolase, partial [Myxococcota bacterium]
MRPQFDIQWLDSFDGLRLRVGKWSEGEARRGTVLMCTGRNESLERYEEFAAGFSARGFASWCFDWRGQGLSGRESQAPARGHVKRFEAYLRDLRQILEQPLRGVRPFVLAHSMGAHLCLRYAHDEPRAFRAMILSAPMIEIETGILSMSAAGWIARLGKGVLGAEAYLPGQRTLATRARRFQGNRLTGDRARFERNVALIDTQPELFTGGATYGWLAAAVDSMTLARAPGFPEAIETPTLLLTAGADRVVKRATHAPYAERMPNGQHRVID